MSAIDIGQQKLAGLGRDLRLQENVQEQVAQLFAQVRNVVGVERFQYFVTFFQKIFAKRLMRLLAIPGAALRRAEMRDHFAERVQRTGTRSGGTYSVVNKPEIIVSRDPIPPAAT